MEETSLTGHIQYKLTAIITLLYIVLDHWGMSIVEGRPLSFATAARATASIAVLAALISYPLFYAALAFTMSIYVVYHCVDICDFINDRSVAEDE
jgi:hypothetical protein